LGQFAPFNLFRGRIVFFGGHAGHLEAVSGYCGVVLGWFFFGHFGCLKAILGLLGSLSGAVFGPFLAVSGHF
jgi:hypothetical protein